MKAAVVKAWGEPPEYTDFAEPAPSDGTEVATRRGVRVDQPDPRTDVGKPLRQQEIQLPAIAGVDGVGGWRTAGWCTPARSRRTA